MCTFIKNLRRIVACLLVLLLIPYPNAYAKETGTELTVECCDIFQQDRILSTTVLETNGGYYISLHNALDMLGLKQVGDHYVSPNGLVKIYPDTKNLTKIVHDGDDWFALEQLMTELDTIILAADGKLYYSCVPINQSLLQAELGRIMTADVYNAFFLEDLPGLSVLTAFAFTFNNLWNQPIEAVTGQAYANDIGAVLLEVMKHHQDNDSLARIMSEKLEGINEVRDLVLGAHQGLEWVYELAQSPMPGGGYLLFGIEGTGLLHELMEADSFMAKMGVDISDTLGVIAQLHETGKIPKMYADALTRVLDTASAQRYSDAVILVQAERILQIYHDHLEDNRAALAAEGIMMTAEDIANNIIADGVLKETLGSKLTKASIEIMDTIPGNPFGNTFEKNQFVQNAALCVKLQTFFREIYNSNNVSRCDGESAMILRDAAMLYLKTAWTAYDAAGFDTAIAGAVQRAQSLIDDELVMLAGFSDNMFCTQKNEPLPEGSLGSKASVSDSKPADKTPSDESAENVLENNCSADHASYFTFLATDLYVDYISNPNIRRACAVQYIDNYYTFRDLNSDGVDELILWLGYTGADGEILIFTLEGGTIHCMGNAVCDGTGTQLFCADHDDDFFLACFDGIGLYADSYRIIGDSLWMTSEDATIPHRWYAVDWIGSMPLTVTDREKESAPVRDDKEQENSGTAWQEFMNSDACMFYLESDVLFEYWTREYLATKYWIEDVENDGTEELIVWAAGGNPAGGIFGEILVFGMEDGEPVCLGKMVCNNRISISGHAGIPGFLLVNGDSELEQLTLCRIGARGLKAEENYMVTDTGWYALDSLHPDHWGPEE